MTTLTFAIENGPGPQLAASSFTGGRCRLTISFGTPSHGLSSIVRHTIIVITPPGLTLRRMLRKPATGLSKNCVPNREKQKSNRGWNGVAQHVGFDEANIAHAGGGRVLPAILEKRFAAIDAEHRSARTNALGNHDRRVAEPASDVDDPIAGPQLKRREDLRAMERQAIDEDVLDTWRVSEPARDSRIQRSGLACRG